MKRLGLLLVFLIFETFAADEFVTAYIREPHGIMGTSCRLVVVLENSDRNIAEEILLSTESVIRKVESYSSNWISDSEISIFNSMGVGLFEFSAINAAIIRAGHKAFEDTNGAFDMTCRPLIHVWNSGEKNQLIPTAGEIEIAREESNWTLIELHKDRVVYKKSPSTSLDLGGIAKGYAIDLAVESMKDSAAIGGLVDIGGDLRFFGRSQRPNGKWIVMIENPVEKGSYIKMEFSEGKAVCTSGNYARYMTIEGRRYSHIIDPRSGYPTDKIPSVTIIDNTAMDADIWATALSVLGKSGLADLPDGTEALMVYGPISEKISHSMTEGFRPYLADPIE